MNPKHTFKGKLFTDLVLKIFQLNGTLLDAGDIITRPFQLTSSKWQVLGAIGSEPKTVARIAKEMGLARQSVQRTTNLLMSAGFCELSQNPHHARSGLLGLTQKGRDTLFKIERSQIKWANAISKNTDEKILKSTLAFLGKIQTALE